MEVGGFVLYGEGEKFGDVHLLSCGGSPIRQGGAGTGAIL
jgi:hypothetical protein